jgi:hypothetical protein
MIAAAISAFVVIVDGEQVFATREQQAPLRGESQRIAQ